MQHSYHCMPDYTSKHTVYTVLYLLLSCICMILYECTQKRMCLLYALAQICVGCSAVAKRAQPALKDAFDGQELRCVLIDIYTHRVDVPFIGTVWMQLVNME